VNTKYIEVDTMVYQLLSESAAYHGLSLIEMLERIAGAEYERQQIASSKG